ncbi:MAG TPA: branched-chain amino acid ABC transporter permease, partial [Micromonosporaceae bacterium]
MLRIREHSVAHRAAQFTCLVVIAAVALWIPNNATTGTIGLWNQAFILAIAGMGLNLIYGYVGIISVGHSAFFGVGAYTTAILVLREDWAPTATIPVAVVIAFVVGCVVALPATRIKGLYLVLVTMAVGLLFPALLTYPKLTWLTGGSLGLSSAGYVRPPAWAAWM